MGHHGVVSVETISVLSMMVSLFLPCVRRQAPHHCGDPDPSRTIGLMSVFFSVPGSQRFWNEQTCRLFHFPRQALGLRPSDQCCHHETWLHWQFVDWNKWSRQALHDGHIRLKKSSKTSLALVMSAQPLALLGSCDCNCSSSRNDLMSSRVFARLPHVRRISTSSILEFSMCHFPSRTPCASCLP